MGKDVLSELKRKTRGYTGGTSCTDSGESRLACWVDAVSSVCDHSEELCESCVRAMCVLGNTPF